MDKSLLLGILVFVVGVLQLLLQQPFVPPAWIPFILIVIGVLNVLISNWGVKAVARLRGK